MMLKYLSFIIGHLVRIKGPLARLALRIFANFYKVDLNAAEKPLCDYACIGDFFIRDLKPGLRPVAQGLVSPVDGTLRDAGPIRDGKISHVKGVDYAARDLLGGAGETDFKHYYNFY